MGIWASISDSSRSFGTSSSAVSAEPPKSRRSILAQRWVVTPNASAIFFAAVSSIL